MRKSIYSAGAVVASVALLAVGAPTASQAATQKELNICWKDETVHKTMDLEVVADGPSYKSTTLDAGECMAWDVRPGLYKLTVENMEEFIHNLSVESGDCKHDTNPHPMVIIKRMGDTYESFDQAAFLNGEVWTNVKKDRRTTATMVLACEEDTLNSP